MRLKENALVFLTNLEAEQFIQDNLYNEIKVTWTHNEFFIVDKWWEKILIDKSCFESEKIEIPVRIIDTEENTENIATESEDIRSNKTFNIFLWGLTWFLILLWIIWFFYKERQIQENIKKEEIKILDKYETYTLLDNDLDKEIDNTLRQQEELKKQLQENYKKIKDLKKQKENILNSKINLTWERPF